MVPFGDPKKEKAQEKMSSKQTAWDKRYKRHDHIVSRAIIGETLLVPISGQLADMQHIFTLNPVADHIWNHLDGERSTGEIFQGILAEFDVTEDEASTDLHEFIEELRAADLIEEVT
jgi:hypothetical protein